MAAAKGSIAEQMSTFDADFDKLIEERDASLKDVTAEIARVEEALTNLQVQLVELESSKSGIQGEIDNATSKTASGNALLFELLSGRAVPMKERAAEMTAAQQEQEGRVAEALVDDVGSELVKTYNKFINETVPILDSLPESYRPMLLGAHDETITKLRAHVDKARGAKIKAKGAQVNIEIAYAVDAPDDLAELVTLIIPVDPTVQMEWNLRSEDLETWLAARCVQGIY